MRVAVAAHDGADLVARTPRRRRRRARSATTPAGLRAHRADQGRQLLYWESGCIFVTVDADGTKELPGDTEFAVDRRGIATWNDDDRELLVHEMIDRGPRAVEVNGKDYKNVIKFRDSSWCRPATKDEPAKCYSDSSAGITTATYVDDGDPPRRRDRRRRHRDQRRRLLDLGRRRDARHHRCNAELAQHADPRARPPARARAPVPRRRRSAADRRQRQPGPVVLARPPTRRSPRRRCTTSRTAARPRRRPLEADDINAICTIYPTSKDPGTCSAVSSGAGCCDAGRDRSAPLGPLALTALVGLLALRRPRRAR